MTALFDSNVVIPELVKNHVHHDASRLAFANTQDNAIVIATHSLSECYNQLTSGGSGRFSVDGARAARVLTDLAGRVDVRTLSSGQTIDALSQFAQIGGRGPRLYDFLIGKVAALGAIPTIVTWNTTHFIPLFPQLRVLTPPDYLETL